MLRNLGSQYFSVSRNKTYFLLIPHFTQRAYKNALLEGLWVYFVLQPGTCCKLITCKVVPRQIENR